jgi:hypothetical protein
MSCGCAGHTNARHEPLQQGAHVILLGVILLILGVIFSVGILWTIGIILIVVGAILWLLGSMDRRHYW